MAVLPVIKMGHPTLRKVAKPVTQFDIDLENFVSDLIETMKLNDGIGLAAPQVNVSKRLFVVDKELINEDWQAQAYINPEILSREGSERIEEGCLSIPGVRAEVDRPAKIRARYQLLNGKTVEEEMDGVLARVFQHEYDHLEGILFVDKLPLLKRKLLEPQLKELEGAYAYR
ncbi:MAG: peptide deformylase [Calditrichia bacterium]